MMAKYVGKIGYGASIEDPEGSGNWKDQITERVYRGDLIKINRNLTPSENLIGDIFIRNSISIVADAYAIEHYTSIRYVEVSGDFWIVSNIEVQHPRLILSLGGRYNGPTA